MWPLPPKGARWLQKTWPPPRRAQGLPLHHGCRALCAVAAEVMNPPYSSLTKPLSARRAERITTAPIVLPRAPAGPPKRKPPSTSRPVGPSGCAIISRRGSAQGSPGPPKIPSMPASLDRWSLVEASPLLPRRHLYPAPSAHHPVSQHARHGISLHKTIAFIRNSVFLE